MFEQFKFIPEPADQPINVVRTGYCVCLYCGSRVETGIVNIAEHAWDCTRERPKGWQELTLNDEGVTKK